MISLITKYDANRSIYKNWTIAEDRHFETSETFLTVAGNCPRFLDKFNDWADRNRQGPCTPITSNVMRIIFRRFYHFNGNNLGAETIDLLYGKLQT